MDKIAANNHFVTMRKEVKKAKAMVSGNLIRKMNKLKAEREKLDDETKIKKMDNKIATIHEEIKLLKTVDPYKVSKNATLKPDPKLWNKIIGDDKATTEERLIARIIIKNNIQKQVLKFRTDYKDCDEWINEYIEYREKKKEIETASKPNRRKPNNNNKVKSSKGNQENLKQSKSNGKQLDNSKKTTKNSNINSKESRNREETNDDETLHPSWEMKRKEKELLKAAFKGELGQSKRITFDG